MRIIAWQEKHVSYFIGTAARIIVDRVETPLKPHTEYFEEVPAMPTRVLAFAESRCDYPH